MNEPFPRRKPQRLPGYDYSQPGAYFVTICTQNRAHLFGRIENRVLHLNDAGQMVQSVWNEVTGNFPTVRLDEFIVMPNHAHGVLWLTTQPDTNITGRGGPPCPPDAPCPPAEPDRHGGLSLQSLSLQETGPSLPDVMQWFKSLTTARYRHGVKNDGWTPFPGALWQRSYYDHIVRREEALNRIRQYIRDNPRRWTLDRYNPEPIGPDPMAAEIWRMLQQP